MRRQNEENKHVILDYINEYFNLNKTIPSVREISEGTGIAISTVHRYLCAMKESGELEYSGRRNIGTLRMGKEGYHHALPVLGSVTCGPGDYEEENIIEYIRMPERLVGKGDFFALIAKGESMTDIGVFPGDYVIIRKQDTAEIGDIIVALYDDGLVNLKQLCFDEEKEQYYLYSCNKNQKKYAPIYVDEVRMQGVAVCTVHSIGKQL
ncbi:MAG: helix-turn-helix domain-containing protein [Lachnospiraceae bacterium]|nr:helix-turn-helix domain-containing protein [Lachnospiraceae bacterium]